MKVLYITPQATRDSAVAKYTFLDEEIAALRTGGIRPYVLSRRVRKVEERDGIVLWPLPRERSARARIRSVGFMVRSAANMPPANLLSVFDWYQAGRIERVAAEVVRREKIDLVHSHFGWPDGLGGSLVKATTKVPLVACLRGSDILIDESIDYGSRSRPFYDRNLRRLLRTADRTLYFSKFMAATGIELGAEATRTTVLHKAVDLSQFGVTADRAAAREALGLGRKPMFLTVGSLIARKGIDLILESLARIREEFDFSFVICGDGPERETLGALARRLSLEDRTHFVGRITREEIPKYFGACEIFVLASVLEAAGNVLFEAMAAARPIVCTAAGGPDEYVEDGVTGFVVPVGDAAAMADRMRALLRDERLRDELGKEGRHRALTQYAYPRLVSDILNVYGEVLGHGHAAHDRRTVADRTAQPVATFDKKGA
jgi:glycosyltransferase involved in cell wall biosynthesis